MGSRPWRGRPWHEAEACPALHKMASCYEVQRAKDYTVNSGDGGNRSHASCVHLTFW